MAVLVTLTSKWHKKVQIKLYFLGKVSSISNSVPHLLLVWVWFIFTFCSTCRKKGHKKKLNSYLIFGDILDMSQFLQQPGWYDTIITFTSCSLWLYTGLQSLFISANACNCVDVTVSVWVNACDPCECACCASSRRFEPRWPWESRLLKFFT